MPGNEVEDGIFKVNELDNSFDNQRISHLSRAVGGNWSVLDCNHWVGKLIQIGGPPTSNLRNHILQPLDFVKGHNVESLHMSLNYTKWTPRSEYSKIPNETLIGRQNFVPNENQPGIYGGSTCYNQQILNLGAFSIFKSQPENECAGSPTLTTNSERSEITEASGDYNFHRGQQQIARDKEVIAPKPQTMQQPGFNDMQVLQQHIMFKQLQEFQRQQQLGGSRQQSPLNQLSVQFPPLINGTPVQDTTQMPRNWMQRGVSNKTIFPQEQGQALHSIGLSQDIDVSLYGTPVANARANMSQYPHFQGMAYDSVNQMKSNLGQLPVQGVNNGIFPGNLQEGNVIQVNASVKEFNARQAQGSWPTNQQTKQLGSSEDLVPLDPMEAKILYNMDENIWDAFGSQQDTEAATLENPECNSFSSIQCGTWSALMQSAVAETSSSDTGLQEEWSGLTFQNTEQATVDFSSFVDSEKEQPSWVDHNLQNASSGTSSTFPGFHQPEMQFLVKQREESSNDNYNPNKATVQDGEKGQQSIHSGDIWAGQMFEHSLSASKHKEGVLRGSSIDKGFDGMVNSQLQMSDKGAYESQEKWLKHQQRENSNDSSKGLTSHEKGHGEQLRFSGNFSSSVMNVDKGSIPNYQQIPIASEELPSIGDRGSNASTSYHGSVLPEGSNISAQTSEHMLELLHKVDHQSNDNGTFKQMAEMHGAESQDTSIAQMYLQSSSSQGFGLRLAPPSQKLANPNTTLMAINDLNSKQVNAELGVNNQASQSPFSLNSSLQSHELAQRTRWEQMHSNLSQSSQASLPGSVSRFSPLNQMPSQDTSEQMRINSVSQPFPFSHHSNLSGMTQQGENSARPYNVWRNVPTQRQPSSNLPSSMDSANNNVPVDKTAEGSTYSNIQGYDHGEEQHHISSNIPDNSSGGMSSQFFLGKPSKNLHIQSPLERVDGVATGQDGRVWPSAAAAALVSSGQVSSLEVTNQVAVLKPKKRKFMALELVPWHKEVMQEIQRPQNMSVAEQDWARATNRLIEKVDDEVEMIQDVQLKHRSKRRIVLTTQLVQQLLRVAPAFIFSADAATNYGIISYFVSRLSLGDASSFSYCSVNSFLAPLSNNNTSSEKPKSECNTERCLEVVNSFSDRTKQLENELIRLDKTTSIAIIRAELQELERFTVINRFAKFHVGGQTDGTGVPKLSPQRYIVAIPVPQYLPEGVQCLSL